MQTSVETKEIQNAVVPPGLPLDEARWQAWVAKGRARDELSSTARTKAVKWASIAVLLASAGFWPNTGTVEIAVRFLVTIGAIVVMAQAIRARHYGAAASFGALALLYNPVVPVFGYSGDWQRAVIMASAVLFGTSLAWRTRAIARMVAHD